MAISKTVRTVKDDGAPQGYMEEVTSNPQDSLELSRNAKGDLSWSVKVYGHDASELEQRGSKALNAVEALVARAAKMGA